MQLEAFATELSNSAAPPPGSITTLLSRASDGDQQAFSHIIPLIYRDLHRIAEGYLRNELPGHTLQATALINEAYVRLAGARNLDCRDRTHFFALAARVMRRILVDHARARHAAKRGAGLKVTLDNNVDTAPEREEIVMLLDDALIRLAKQDQKKAKLVEMRFFGGMTADDIADYVSMPVHSVRRELRLAQAWLRREIEPS